MEAIDLANALQTAVRAATDYADPNDVDLPHDAVVEAGYEETDFFVAVGSERFLVAVMKVSE